jgi:ribosomal protein S17E
MDKDKLIEKIKKNQEEIIQKYRCSLNDKDLLSNKEVTERFKEIDRKYKRREKISKHIWEIIYK